MKRLLSIMLITALLISCAALGACNGGKPEDKSYSDPIQGIEVTASSDKYRNFYHIWVSAFADSNGDETGDLQGITEHLDYLNDGDPETDTDLGVNAIWLSPISPSDTYHKYDVDDYMDVDSDFGTLEDFDRLISECKKRGINVILDLVLNHCGTKHEFFTKALSEAKQGNLDGYARYYRFAATGDRPGDGYRQVTGQFGLWYEGQFNSEMPDWNLAYQGTRDYFEQVAKFWLDRGVAGFRLDAVRYMEDDVTDSTEFIGWFKSACEKYNPDTYLVGENWQNNSQIYDVYESGIDSQFAFGFATASGHYINAANSGTGMELAVQLKKFDNNSDKANPNAINAMFLSNHDMNRSGNYFSGEIEKMKMAAALYMLTPGCSYTYYGEEIGMMVPPDNTKNDAFYRSPMVWDSEVEPDIWCTADAYSIHDFGGVKQQTDDPDSLLSFYRRLIKIRNQNPGLVRGKITQAIDVGDDSICAYAVEYEGMTYIVIHNLIPDSTQTVTLPDSVPDGLTIRADAYAAGLGGADSDSTSATQATTAQGEIARFNTVNPDGTVTLLPRSSVVLMKAE